MHVKYYPYFDSPKNYPKHSSYYSWGGSPELLRKLGWYLRERENDIKEVSISFYLFNNYNLHQYFKSLANKGVKINVVSIPLEGYDHKKPKYISEHCSKTKKYYHNKITKYEAAKMVYSEFDERSNPNYKLYIFPHMFIRSKYVHPFSRGRMPYSLHIKNAYIELKNGNGSMFLTSSNMAVRDLVKEENLLIIENDTELNKQTKAYFSHLQKNSIEINNFNTEDNYYSYPITQFNAPINADSIILAPFYTNSAALAETRIKTLIDHASKRIYISGQHISSYKYSIRKSNLFEKEKAGRVEKTGFLFNVLQKASQGIDVKILSQTFVDENGNSHNCRRPGNIRSFQEFTSAYSKHKKLQYFVNDDLHNKFIIIDNLVIITTFNYTPTQFMYLPFVEINKFENIPRLKYKGVFSEVGQMVIVRNSAVLEKYLQQFIEICASDNTYRHQ